MPAGEFIAWPLRGAATALRTAGAALCRLANLLDPDAAPADPGAQIRVDDDALGPRAGTRERIGTVLAQAHDRWDAVHAPSRTRR